MLKTTGKKKPDFSIEESLHDEGFNLIAGIDEAGRGPLAGPVVAAAVMLEKEKRYDWYDYIYDSKALCQKEREELYKNINRDALSVGVGICSSALIDEIGISKATRRAMYSAVLGLNPFPDSIIIDYVRLPNIMLHQKSFIKGDCLSCSIACASIIAKVTRDKIMLSLDTMFPEYGFRENKGYGTKHHLERISEKGPSLVHRHSFKPIKYRYEGKLL